MMMMGMIVDCGFGFEGDGEVKRVGGFEGRAED